MCRTTNIRITHSKKKRRWGCIIWCLGVLSIVIILIHFMINIYLGILFKKHIERFEQKHAGLYHIEYKAPHVNLFTGSVTVKQFRLISNVFYEEPRVKPEKDRNIWELDIPLLKLKGIGWVRYLFSQCLKIDKIVLKKARFKCFSSVGTDQDTSLAMGYKKKDISIPFRIESITVKSFSFQQCSLEMVQQKKTISQARIFDFDFSIVESNILCKPNEHSHSILDLKTLDFKIKDLKINLPDRMYSLHIQELGVSAPLSKIWMKTVEIIPRHKKFDFSRKLGYRKSRMCFNAKWLHFNSVQVGDIISMARFRSETLSIRGFHWEFYRDKRIPLRITHRPKQFPQELLRQLKFYIRVDLVRVSNGYIVYEEQGEMAKKPARIFFSDIQLNIANITNDPLLLKDNISIKIQGTAKLMGKSLFKPVLTIPIRDRHDRFYFSGSLQSIEVSELNPLFNNDAIHIESGTLNKLIFSASANRYRSRGWLKAHYNGLKISLLSKRNYTKKETIASFFANLIILSNNPRGRKPLRIGNMYFRREVPKSMLNLMWKSFLTGIKSSIGLKKRKK